jgi:cholesterol oxidase
MKKRYDCIVIGTGFGGSVAAYRLAEASRDVCVLERGRRYGRTDFASTSRELTFWNAGQGLIDFHGSPDMDVVMAAGVGGGSLVYANVHIRPAAKIFDDWPGGLDLEALEPHFRDVADMLRITPFPGAPDVAKAGAMTDAAHAIGRTPKPPDLAVFFGQSGVTVKDPYNRGGPVQTGCTMCGRCVTGCPHHAKNTLDLNYLYLAEHRHGAEVFPLNEAVYVAPIEEGAGYAVHFRDHATGKTGSVEAEKVILGAGSIGSTALLLRSRRDGYLPGLSAALGRRFSPNGDFLAAALFTDGRVDPTVGPTITTMVDFRDDLDMIIEEGGFPEMISWYARSLYPNPGAIRRLLRVFYLRFIRTMWSKEPVNSDKLLRLLFHGAEPPAARMLPFLCIGVDAADGGIVLDDDGRAVVNWKNRNSRRLWKSLERETKRLSKAMGAVRILNPAWSLGQKLITVHPLGGCAMAETPDHGVVDPRGEVFGYPGLYVADGAVMPRALGVNPAMTIAAMSEYISRGIVS